MDAFVRYTPTWTAGHAPVEVEAFKAEVAALAARLAQAERVVEAARAWRAGRASAIFHGIGEAYEFALNDALFDLDDALDGTAGPGEEVVGPSES